MNEKWLLGKKNMINNIDLTLKTQLDNIIIIKVSSKTITITIKELF